MDNLTHSLIGVAIAESAKPWTRDDRGLAKATLWSAVLGSNLPDGDVIVRYGGHLGLPSGRLASLLTHRGYTHTLLAAIPLGFLAAWLGTIFAGVRRPGVRAFLFTALIGILGVLLHVGADFWNDYGVHPFSPLMNGWFYGGFIFIIEPLIIFTLLPLAFFSARSKAGKVGWCIAGTLLLGLMLKFLPLGICVAALAWLAGMSWIQRRFRSSPGVAPACAAWIAVLAILSGFFLGSRLARARVYADAAYPVDQIATSPAPSNPFCWKVTESHFEPGGIYVVRAGEVNLWPFRANAASCLPLGMRSEESDGKTELPRSPGAQLQWSASYRQKLSDLRESYDGNCVFAQLSRFARFPYLGEEGYAMDLRYGFTRFNLRDLSQCMRSPPPWVPPLEELTHRASTPSR